MRNQKTSAQNILATLDAMHEDEAMGEVLVDGIADPPEIRVH